MACQEFVLGYLLAEENTMFYSIDKLQLKGQNLGRVFNSRLGRACICCAIAYITKRPNLKLKTRPEQLLVSHLLAFVLPIYRL